MVCEMDLIPYPAANLQPWHDLLEDSMQNIRPAACFLEGAPVPPSLFLCLRLVLRGVMRSGARQATT